VWERYHGEQEDLPLQLAARRRLLILIGYSSGALVGMHPDEATDMIIDIGLRYNKPFAMVPCCVFSQKFPNRRKPHDPVAPVVS